MTMAWVAIGTTAVSLAASAYSSNKAAQQGADQASAASNAENNAIAKANMTQIVRNNYKAGLLQMQKGLQKKQAVQQGFDTTVMAQQAMGQSHANAAASGTVGASADAVSNDIQMKLGEAQAQQAESFEAMLTNYNTEIDTIRMNALHSTIDAKEYRYTGPSSGQMFGAALVSGVAQAAGNYAGQRMKLGLGPTNPTATNATMQGFQNTNPYGPSNSLGSGTFNIW